MHFPLLKPLTPIAEPWGSEEPSLRNTNLTYFMLCGSLYFTSKIFMLFMLLYFSDIIDTS
jgi:hypothetical protein